LETGVNASLQGIRRKSVEQKNLMNWLVGMPDKTITNVDVRGRLSEVLDESHAHFTELFTRLERGHDLDLAWLLLVGGAATLTIRGSDKSKIGKHVERVLVKSILTILGFTLNENFWLNIQRDQEVTRETDAEVLTRRGRIIIEVGLIGAGNQEVIEDKVGRVGRNGIILFDKIGARSNVQDTATVRGVNLVQIRDGQPLVDLHRILSPLVDVALNDPPTSQEDISRAVQELPCDIFDIGNALAEIDGEAD
jgi:hypothetical protein